MLRVPTYVAPSPIAGMGVFAGVDIPAGTLIWTFDEGADCRIRPEDLAAFPEPYQSRLRSHVYLEDTGFYVFCADNIRFMNHSEDPNCVEPPGPNTFAGRDIRAGEEMTCDYRVFDRDSREKGFDFEVVKIARD